MKAARIFLSLLVCLCVMASQSFANDFLDRADSEVYKEKVGPMLVRGLLNTVTSPVDILVQTVDKTKDGPPLIGTLTGMAGGLGCTALRVGSGITDVALFWVPGFNGFPVNRSYHNCLLCEKSEPVAQQVISQPSYVVPVVSQPVPVATPLVTVTESPTTVSTPKRKVGDPYKYVKK